MGLTELLFIGEFGYRTDRPFDRPFQNEACEHVGILVSRQLALYVEMSGAPIPTLGDNPCNTKTRAAWTKSIGKENPELGRNTGAGLILKNARPQHVFEEYA